MVIGDKSYPHRKTRMQSINRLMEEDEGQTIITMPCLAKAGYCLLLASILLKIFVDAISKAAKSNVGIIYTNMGVHSQTIEVEWGLKQKLWPSISQTSYAKGQRPNNYSACLAKTGYWTQRRSARKEKESPLTSGHRGRVPSTSDG
ncbi:20008_t:CDS:2, partial [Gigaspora rosea]